MPQHSPYTPGELAQVVPGRQAQLASIEERLVYMTGLQRLVGRIRLDQGPRGVGKTSMLAAAQRMARQNHGVLTAWASAGSENPIIGTLISEIAEATSEWHHEDHDRISRLAQRLSVKVTAGVPGIAQVEAGIAPAPSQMAQSPNDTTTREFAGLVQSTVEGAQRNNLRGLAIFVDEIQSADQQGLRVLAGAWQRLQRTSPGVPAAVFAVGLPNSKDAIRGAGGTTFAERFDYPEMAPLDPDASRLALVAPAGELGVNWRPDALDAAVTYSGGYPYAVQLIGDNTWRSAGFPHSGQELTGAHVAAAIPAVEQAMTAVYEARWADATRTEREAMLVLAGYGDQPVSRQQLVAGMGGDRDVSDLRASLLRKGIIVPSGHGELSFSVPGMAAYLRQRRDPATH
jgi:hypothetical protein